MLDGAATGASDPVGRGPTRRDMSTDAAAQAAAEPFVNASLDVPASVPASEIAQRLALVSIDDTMRSQVDPLVEARAGRSTAASGSRGLIIMLFTNSGFMPFLKNLICGMERVHVTNYLVVGFDNATCPAMAEDFGLGQAPTVPRCVFPYAHRPLTTTGIARYRSLEFNRMVMQRPLWILHLLRRGFETLQVDLDISWIADPQPLFASARYARHDLLFQSEGGHGFNAGFYLARPGPGAISILEQWTLDLTRQSDSKAFEEQHSLGRSLGRHNRSIPTRFEKLNITEFPNGKLWWQYKLPSRKRDAYIVVPRESDSHPRGRAAAARVTACVTTCVTAYVTSSLQRAYSAPAA